MTGIIDLVIVMIEDIEVIEGHQGIEIEIKAVGTEEMITTEETLLKSNIFATSIYILDETSVSTTNLKSVLVLIVHQSKI